MLLSLYNRLLVLFYPSFDILPNQLCLWLSNPNAFRAPTPVPSPIILSC